MCLQKEQVLVILFCLEFNPTYKTKKLRTISLSLVAGFTPLTLKHHWDLMGKMVFWQDFWLFYFDLLIMLMTLFLSFYYFYCCCSCFVGVFVSGFNILSLLLFYIFIKPVLILCGYVRYYFVKLLGIPIIYVCGVCIQFYVIFNFCNFSITFFVTLSWILFSYLLFHLKNFPIALL